MAANQPDIELTSAPAPLRVSPSSTLSSDSSASATPSTAASISTFGHAQVKPLPPTPGANPSRSPSPTAASSQVNASQNALPSGPSLSPNPSLSTTLRAFSPNPTLAFRSTQGTATSGRTASSVTERLFQRPWIQPTIGVVTLIVTLIALFVYNHRSFIMAKWTEENDMLQACAQLLQSRSNTSYPQCENLLDKGPRPPPYLHDEIYGAGFKVRSLAKRAVDLIKGGMLAPSNKNGYFENSLEYSSTGFIARQDSYSNSFILIAAAILSGLCTFGIVLGMILLSRSRPKPKDTDPLSASFFAGDPTFRPRTEPNQQRLVTIQPDEPGRTRVLKQIRRRVRRAYNGSEGDSSSDNSDNDITNTSFETIPRGWTNNTPAISSGVSLTKDNGENHTEGLVEVEPKDGTRRFIDLKTGELHLLSPWKSSGNAEEDDELPRNPDFNRSGTVQRAIAELGMGGAALAEGKTLEDSMIESLRHAHTEPVTQKAGDSLAGEVSNE